MNGRRISRRVRLQWIRFFSIIFLILVLLITLITFLFGGGISAIKQRWFTEDVATDVIEPPSTEKRWWFQSKEIPGEDVLLPDYVEEAFLEENPYSRPGDTLYEVNGIVIHYVGNPDTTAIANRNYFDSLKDSEDTYASAHFIVGLEGEVIQCIPLTEISYGSNERNSDTIAIEVCHPDDSGKFSDVSMESLQNLTLFLCDAFDLTEDDILRHYDITGKECPIYYVKNPDAWEKFLSDMATKLERQQEMTAS